MPSDPRLFGIRHHGPGSVASLVAALNDFWPDSVLLECPADGEALATLRDAALVPPVALLLCTPKQQGQASFLPFAGFLPEVAGRAVVLARRGARARPRLADEPALWAG